MAKNSLKSFSIFEIKYPNTDIKKQIDENEYIKLIETLGETKQIKKLLNFTEIEKQAYKIHKWGKNVFVKIPVTNSKGKFMGKLIKDLNNLNIKLNITAVYTSSQTRQILKNLNKKSKVIISIFAGRAADVGKDPIPEFKKSIKYSKKFKNVEILWASVREPYNYLQAKQLGCHIITVPPKLIEKIEKFGKPFQKLTKETVVGFLKDSKKSRFSIT